MTFSPTTAAVESATLQITDNGPASPQSIALTGTGVARNPSLAFIPGSLTFNPVAQGSSEGPQSIQITNVGSAALHISNVALGGSNPQDFFATNTCTASAIVVNAGCNIDVSFTPSATGARSASISLTDDAPNSPQTLFVQGNGAVPFLLNPSPQSSTSASVNAGQTAQYSLQVNPGTGFNGNISLSCSGLPLATACSFSPALIIVASSNPVPFTTKITTTGSASAASIIATPDEIVSRATLRPFAALAILGLLLLCVGTAKNQRSAPARAAALCTLLLACIIPAGISGCGGASNVITSPPQQVITPKGNYVVTVTASAGSLPPQTISLTLTVN